MLLSRTNAKKKQAAAASHDKSLSKGLSSDIHDYLSKTDFSGALAILQSKRRNGASDINTSLWIAYFYSHLGD